jgi:predicted secreted acid phosphatase
MFFRCGILGLVFLINSFAVQAINFDSKVASSQQRDQHKQYFESGAYFKEIEKKLFDGKEYLDRQLQQPRQNRLAIVLDIDETALSNYRHLERLSFTQNVPALTGAMMLANAEPIPAVLGLYRYATEHKIAVFFISSRPNTPEFLAVTMQNLKNAGYNHWQELILKPIEKDEIPVHEFKTNARRQIAAQGYDIVLNIGDQEADLQGGYAEVRLKIPNPFYGLS